MAHKSIFSIALVLALLSSPWSHADKINMLEGVKLERSDKEVVLDLSFEKPISAKGLKPVYERNFAQFVIPGIGVKTARLLPVADSSVEKVFVYQYEPGVARVRLIMKSDSQAAKGRINLWNSKPNQVRFVFKDPVASMTTITKDEEVLLKNVMAQTSDKTANAVAVENSNADKSLEKSAEKSGEKLIDKISSKSGDKPLELAATAKPSVASLGLEKKQQQTPQSIQPMTEPVGIKAEPSRYFVRMAVSLFVVIGFFIGVVLLMRKYSSKLNLSKLPFGKKERLIQVIATHRLGKSQAVSLVKITGEYMVLGTSGDNVSLITKLGSDVNVEKYLEDRYWGGTFEKHLKDLATPTKSGAEHRYDGPQDLGNSSASVESEQVSAFRSSIKEKVTKLKPLA